MTFQGIIVICKQFVMKLDLAPSENLLSKNDHLLSTTGD